MLSHFRSTLFFCPGRTLQILTKIFRQSSDKGPPVRELAHTPALLPASCAALPIADNGVDTHLLVVVDLHGAHLSQPQGRGPNKARSSTDTPGKAAPVLRSPIRAIGQKSPCRDPRSQQLLRWAYR